MRYGGLDVYGRKLVGLNNIELISDRPLEVNLAEIAQAKEEFPDRAVIVSLMVETEREAWHEIVKRAEQTGADGFELNFGCPHGMSERNMGAAVGQVPEYVEMITSWVKEVATIPVLVKLTPNITNIELDARSPPRRGGADGVSAINTINSIVGLDLDTWETRPSVDGKGSHGGYAGPAVKPIALHMVSLDRARTRSSRGLPISGIGGAHTWQDVAEFMLLGASSTVQVCTAIDAPRVPPRRRARDRPLQLPRRARARQRCASSIGGSVQRIANFGDFDLNYQVRAKVDHDAVHRLRQVHRGVPRQPGRLHRLGRRHRQHRARRARSTRPSASAATCARSSARSQDCITMEEQPRELAPMSWNQLDDRDRRAGLLRRRRAT